MIYNVVEVRVECKVSRIPSAIPSLSSPLRFLNGIIIMEGLSAHLRQYCKAEPLLNNP